MHTNIPSLPPSRPLSLLFQGNSPENGERLRLQLWITGYTVTPELHIAGDETWGFVHDKQAIYRLSYMLSPLGHFSILY